MEIKSVCISPKHISNKVTQTFRDTKEKLKKKETWRFDKKKLIIATSVVLIGAAVYLNYVFFLEDNVLPNEPVIGESEQSNLEANAVSDEENSQEASVLTFFEQTVFDRQKAREDALDVLKIVVDNEEALDEAKTSAMDQMAQIAADIQTEANIESVIESKGIEECVAVIKDGKCNVVVKSDGLLANQVAQIKEIVYDQAKINPVDVKIIEKN